MTRTWIFRFVVVALGSGLFACASLPRPPELVRLDELMQNQGELAALVKDAPGEVQQSQDLYRRAEAAFSDGDEEDARNLALMAKSALAIARERTLATRATIRIDKASVRLKNAQAQQKSDEARQKKYQKRVTRMEKILALENKLASEQTKSKKQKEKFTAELSKAKDEQEKVEAAIKKAEAQRLKEEEKRQKAAAIAKELQALRNRMASVAAKIQTAESLEAERFNAAGLRGAKDSLAQAERAIAQNDLELALKITETAEVAAGKSIEIARDAYAKQGKEFNVLAERKALLEIAGKVGANEVKQMERGVVITLLDMFAPQRSLVIPDRHPVLNKIAELAKRYDAYPMIVEGYTDSSGGQHKNLELSTARAQSVVAFFVDAGKLEPGRIKSAGYGESNPVADNSTAEGRAKNRRIEVVFLFR